jgi:hypothetical protein
VRHAARRMRVGHTGVGGVLLRGTPRVAGGWKDAWWGGAVVQYSGAAPGLGHIGAGTGTSAPGLAHMHAACWTTPVEARQSPMDRSVTAVRLELHGCTTGNMHRRMKADLQRDLQHASRPERRCCQGRRMRQHLRCMRHGTWRPVCATFRARYQLEPADARGFHIDIYDTSVSTKT